MSNFVHTKPGNASGGTGLRVPYLAAGVIRVRIVSRRSRYFGPVQRQRDARVVECRCDVDDASTVAITPGHRIVAVGPDSALEVPGHVHAAADRGLDDPVAQELHVVNPLIEAGSRQVRRERVGHVPHDRVTAGGPAAVGGAGHEATVVDGAELGVAGPGTGGGPVFGARAPAIRGVKCETDWDRV